MSDYYHDAAAFPKPEPRKRTKGRAKRDERSIVADVRAACVERDGSCRIATMRPGDKWTTDATPCAGPSQWAHMHDVRRSKTRGLAPDVRHTTRGSFMACEAHHGAYDAKLLIVLPMSVDGADGPLMFGLARRA